MVHPSITHACASEAAQNPITRMMGRAIWLLRRVVDVAVLALLAYMACAILAQVVGRYFFNYSIAWSEETATFAQVWLTLLGAGVAMRYNQHVGVDFLILKAPAPVQRLVSGLAFLLGIWFLAVVVVGSLSMVSIGLMVKSPALRLPMAIPYAALPVGFGYFLIEFAISTLPRVLRGGAPAAKQED